MKTSSATRFNRRTRIRPIETWIAVGTFGTSYSATTKPLTSQQGCYAMRIGVLTAYLPARNPRRLRLHALRNRVAQRTRVDLGLGDARCITQPDGSHQYG